MKSPNHSSKYDVTYFLEKVDRLSKCPAAKGLQPDNLKHKILCIQLAAFRERSFTSWQRYEEFHPL